MVRTSNGNARQKWTVPPMAIELVSDYKPFALSNDRPIPIAWRDPVKKILEDMATQGIISPVSEPTEWTHPLVVVAKRDGTPRICVDLTNLNRFVKRPLHPTQTPKQAVSRVSPSAHPMGMQDRNGQCLQIWENLSFL